jgi:predicted dehydrogenase
MMVARRPDVVLWGAGMVAGVHAEACRSLGWRIRAVASRSPERARTLARTVHARAVTYDDAVRQRLGDVAIVATPPARHVDDAVALLEAGYHVVVEAPIACTLDEADRLVAAEWRVGRPVLYSEHLVASPTVDALLARIGSMGLVTHLSARAVQPPPVWREHDRATWGGGALFDLGVHPVGLVVRTAAEAGAGGPVHVGAVVTDSGTDHEHATVRVDFEVGLRATIVVGWQPHGFPDWDLQASSAASVLRAELYPAPALEHDGEPVTVGPARTSGPSLVDDYGYAPQLSRYWTTIRTGRPVPATSQLGRLVLDVVMAAHWSAGHDAVGVDLPFAGPRDRTAHQLFSSSPGRDPSR